MLYDKKSIVEDADIEAVLQFCGIKHRRKGKFLQIECPRHVKNTGHTDRHIGNCTIGENGKWYCFACQASGDIFDLVKESLNVNFNEACRIIAECSTGSVDYYKIEDEEAVRTARENARMRPFLEEIGLSGRSEKTSTMNGCIIKEVYSEEEAEMYRESGYRVEKTGYDAFPVKASELMPNETYDPVRWLVFAKNRPMSLALLKKSDPEAYRQLVEEKTETAKVRVEMMEDFAELIPDQDLYNAVLKLAENKKEVLKKYREAV